MLTDIKKYPELQNLTEIETNLISLNLLFAKFFILPISRMRGFKDRLVNIPLDPTDVTATINKLPRLPNEANIIPVVFKRKIHN